MESPPKPVRKKVLKTFCTTAEAAERLGVSARTVQLWTENGLLKAWKTDGGHRRITLESLERLLATPGLNPSGARSPEAKARLRVLVVEDEPTLLMLYEMQLRRWAMAPEFELAKDGFEALLKIGTGQPHLLITDLMMPHMDGFEMLRKLRSLPDLADMEIVAVSGLSPEAIAERGGLPSGIPLLPKPIPFDELEQFAERLALRRGLMRSVAGFPPASSGESAPFI
jgi:excisionase family DNA binding protein